VVITRSGNTITIDDRVAISAGKGCKKVKGDKTKVICTTTGAAGEDLNEDPANDDDPVVAAGFGFDLLGDRLVADGGDLLADDGGAGVEVEVS
jgi:hypothetical protein